MLESVLEHCPEDDKVDDCVCKGDKYKMCTPCTKAFNNINILMQKMGSWFEPGVD